MVGVKNEVGGWWWVLVGVEIGVGGWWVLWFDLNDDIKELVILIRKQCSNNKPYVDPRDDKVKQRAILGLVDSIKSEIVPEQSNLPEIFSKLGLRDTSSCREEIENLEEEVKTRAMRNQNRRRFL